MITEIVKQAMLRQVTDIGQLTKQDRRELNKAVKAGLLIKGQGGPFPNLKTVYAVPGFDIDAEREREIKKIEKRDLVTKGMEMIDGICGRCGRYGKCILMLMPGGKAPWVMGTDVKLLCTARSPRKQKRA